MGQPSQITDPFSMEDWFDAFMYKVKNAGPAKIPEDHILFMKHAFAAAWNSRGAAEEFARVNAQQIITAATAEMNSYVYKHFKSVEDEHKAMDDAMDDLKNNPV